jgi:hypothetical protein
MPTSRPAPCRQVRSSDVADAMRPLQGHQNQLLDLKSSTSERALFGPAASISYVPACKAPALPSKARRLVSSAGQDFLARCSRKRARPGRCDRQACTQACALRV